MYVFGSTPARDVVRVKMPVDEVVWRGIDPWRLDLFDPRPIFATVDVDGVNQRLAFTAIGDLCFAYESPDGDNSAVVVTHDGRRPSCFRGTVCPSTLRTGDDQILVVKNFEVLPQEQFKEHLLRYLLLLFHGQQLELGRQQRRGWAVRPYGNIWFREGMVELRSSLYLADLRTEAAWMSCRFAGDMFDTRRINLDWPAAIGRVLDALKDWQPEVSARGVRDIARGVPLVQVEISVREAIEAVAPSLQQIGATPRRGRARSEFTLDGVEFTLRQRTVVEPSSELFVSGQIDVDGAHKMVATRIALFDLAHGQQRLLVSSPAVRTKLQFRTRDWQHRLEKLGTSDLTLLPDAFTDAELVPGCHSEPILRVYAEAIRYAACLDWEAVRSDGVTPAQIMDFVSGKQTVRLAGGRGSISKSYFEERCGSGDHGISPEEMAELLTMAALEARSVQGPQACLTSGGFRDFLLKRLKGLPRERRRRVWCEWLTGWLESECRRPLLGYVFLRASVPDIEEVIEELGRKYTSALLEIQAGRKPTLSSMEEFLKEVEQEAFITRSQASAFRSLVLSKLLPVSVGREFDATPLILYEALERLVMKSVRSHSPSPMAVNSTEQERRVNQLKRNLMQLYGFCQNCSEALFDEVASTRDFFSHGTGLT